MLKQIASLLILMLSLQTFAGPIIVGNGNGEAEFHVLTAQRNIPEVLKQCFSLQACQGSLDFVTRDKLLRTVTELKSLNVLFDSGSALNGQPYQMNKAQATLTLNRDLLYLNEEARGLNYEEAVAYLVQVYFHVQNSDALSNEFLTQLKQTAQEMSHSFELSALDAQKIKVLFFTSGQLSMSLMNRAELLDQQTIVLKDVLNCQALSGRDVAPEAASLLSVGYYYHVDTGPTQFQILSIQSVVRCQNIANESRDYKVWLTLDFVLDRASLKFQKDQTPHSEFLKIE